MLPLFEVKLAREKHNKIKVLMAATILVPSFRNVSSKERLKESPRPAQVNKKKRQDVTVM